MNREYTHKQKYTLKYQKPVIAKMIPRAGEMTQWVKVFAVQV